MTRYFYRDPLAAAWMAKHFGMLIDCKNPSYGSYVWQFPTVYSNDSSFILNNFHAGDIAPNSLHLLEPKAGDVLYSSVGGGVSVEQLICEERAAQTGPHIIQRGGRIIQRNGIPFHWPEAKP